MGWEWLWGALAGATLGAIGWLLNRSAKSYADEAVKPVQEKVAAIQLDIATNYVKHSDLDEMKKEQKLSTRILNRVLIKVEVIASKLNVQLPPADRDEDES